MKKDKILLMAIVFSLGLACPSRAQLVPENGTMTQRDGQGRLRAVLKYKQGHLIRKRLYHENGKLILDTIYKNGVPVVIKTYYIDGKRKSEWTKKSGDASYYLPTGQRNITVPGP